jgi:hypothetical protein
MTKHAEGHHKTAVFQRGAEGLASHRRARHVPNRPAWSGPAQATAVEPEPIKEVRGPRGIGLRRAYCYLCKAEHRRADCPKVTP